MLTVCVLCELETEVSCVSPKCNFCFKGVNCNVMYYFRVKCLPFLTRHNKITHTLVLCKYLPYFLRVHPKNSAQLYYIKRKIGTELV